MANGDEKYRVRSVERAFSILEALKDGGDMRLIDVSRSTMLAKGMVFKLLDTLCSAGYVERDPETGKYRLGKTLFELGLAAGAQMRERSSAHDVLRSLVGQVNETAHLAVLQGPDVLYLDKVESSASLRMVTAVGIRRPAYCTGTGKALLAGLADEDVRRVMDGKPMPRFTPNTICNIDDLLAELALIRTRGYAVDNEENEPGIMCVGAPVRNREGIVVSAISVAGPTIRVNRETIPQLAQILIEAANQISEASGYGS
ncbi:MAG TPA: IclR family transcriptional regulator [Firmicutes bacterium]|jgi:DNA-binding IclR family transcriptional regulator|nr:IclR family transcriptional regulator [Bacillota bacterium]HBK60641.1 IclR family transcriptional regulator [Bacillota bacterium]